MAVTTAVVVVDVELVNSSLKPFHPFGNWNFREDVYMTDVYANSDLWWQEFHESFEEDGRTVKNVFEGYSAGGFLSHFFKGFNSCSEPFVVDRIYFAGWYPVWNTIISASRTFAAVIVSLKRFLVASRI